MRKCFVLIGGNFVARRDTVLRSKTAFVIKFVYLCKKNSGGGN